MDIQFVVVLIHCLYMFKYIPIILWITIWQFITYLETNVDKILGKVYNPFYYMLYQYIYYILPCPLLLFLHSEFWKKHHRNELTFFDFDFYFDFVFREDQNIGHQKMAMSKRETEWWYNNMILFQYIVFWSLKKYSRSFLWRNWKKK